MNLPITSEPSSAISENAQVSTPLKNEQPINDDNKEFQVVMTLFEKAKVARSERDVNWKKYKDFYNGKQWLDQKRPAYKSSPNVNIVRSCIETILPILTDTQPGFDVIPVEPSDYDFADILSETIQSWWLKSGMDHKITEVCKDSLILDAAILKVTWDDTINLGMGDVAVNLIDLNNIYVNPDAEDFDRRCTYVIERSFKTVAELKRMYPDKADQIKSSMSGSTNQKDESSNIKTQEVTLVSPVDKKASSDLIPSSGVNDATCELEIFECWISDSTLIDEQQKDGTTIQKIQYPQGKIITIIPSQKLVLQTKPNPYEDGKWPYVRVVDSLTPRQFYGSGEVEPLLETQKMLNKTASVIFDYLNTMTNPVWIIDTQSNVDPDTLTSQIGLIISKQQGTEVKRESAPPLPSQVFELYNVLQSLADQQSGVNVVTQGRKPTGITAAEALQTMQEAAQTRIRLKERNLQVSLSRLGTLVVSRILQYYNEPRIIRLVGNKYQGKWPAFIEWYVKKDKDGNYAYMSKKHEMTDTGLQSTPWQESTKSSKGLFDINVVGGTSLPYLKNKRADLAMKLFQLQVIDKEELLTSLDWPRKDEVIRRTDQQDQAKAQAMQQGAGPQGAPQGAGPI
jgi:hypothetical protein